QGYPVTPLRQQGAGGGARRAAADDQDIAFAHRVRGRGGACMGGILLGHRAPVEWVRYACRAGNTTHWLPPAAREPKQFYCADVTKPYQTVSGPSCESNHAATLFHQAQVATNSGVTGAVSARCTRASLASSGCRCTLKPWACARASMGALPCSTSPWSCVTPCA